MNYSFIYNKSESVASSSVNEMTRISDVMSADSVLVPDVPGFQQRLASFKTNSMSAEVITQTRTADSNPRGQGRRGRFRGGNNAQDAPPTNRGFNNRNNRAKKEKNVNPGNDIPNNREPAPEQESTTVTAAPQSETNTDSDVCWICAEPVKYYSLSECNHRTCHVCAIRLRALYKKTDCTFCKVGFFKGEFECVIV